MFDEPATPRYSAGNRLLFVYPREYICTPDYTAHSGQIVTIIRPLSYHDEYENLGDPMYRVRADDGWQGDIWESELRESAAP